MTDQLLTPTAWPALTPPTAEELRAAGRDQLRAVYTQLVTALQDGHTAGLLGAARRLAAVGELYGLPVCDELFAELFAEVAREP